MNCKYRKVRATEVNTIFINGSISIYILYFDIRRTDIGSISRRVGAFLNRLGQRKMFDLNVRILVCIKALCQLILLEIYADLYCAFCRLYFYFLLCYITVFIFLFHRVDEGHIVQKSILVGVLFFGIGSRRCCRIVVQCLHIGIIVIIRAVLCDRCHAEFRIVRNCLRIIQCRSYAYQIVIIGIFSLGCILAGLIDLLRCGKILVFFRRR